MIKAKDIKNVVDVCTDEVSWIVNI
jgi:hypothetical protein